MAPVLGPFSLDRAVRAVEKVRERLLRSTAALEAAGLPYAVAGGHVLDRAGHRADRPGGQGRAVHAQRDTVGRQIAHLEQVSRRAGTIDLMVRRGPLGRSQKVRW